MNTLWSLGVAMDFSLAPTVSQIQMRRALADHHHREPTRTRPDPERADSDGTVRAEPHRAPTDPTPAR